MRLVDKLKQFERQVVYLRWANNGAYGKLKYVGFDFIEFEILDTDEMEYVETVLINSQLILEVISKSTDIARIVAEFSSRLPSF